MLALRKEPLSFSQAAARIAIPLATYAAMRSFAAQELVPAAAAEGAFLALLCGALLSAVALVAAAPAIELGLGALLATAALWSLPPGPARGAAVVAVLVATLLVAALRRLPELVRRRELPYTAAAALMLGAQLLLRGHLLFAPERTPKTLFALLGLPLIAGAVVAWMARRHGVVPVVTAACASILLAPGWNVSSLLGWIGLAAGEALARQETPRAWRGAVWLAALLVVARIKLPGLAFLACGVALAAPLPGLGAAFLVALALRWPLDRVELAHSWPQVFWCLLLVPSLWLPERGRWAASGAALLLTMAIPLNPNPGILAAPIALAVLAGSRRPAIAWPRSAWAATLFGAVALLSSYPWLRPVPLPAALQLFGLRPSGWPLLLLVAAVGGLALLGRRCAAPSDGRPWILASAGLALLAACAQLPRPGRALLTPEVPVVLGEGAPSWSGTLPLAEARGLVLETSLANAATLQREMPFATVRLSEAGGQTREWVLHAGIDSGEWAARRPDVLRSATLDSPAPWVSWIADGFFAQRYRSRRDFPSGFRPVKVEVERRPDLPPEIAVALHQVEVLP